MDLVNPFIYFRPEERAHCIGSFTHQRRSSHVSFNVGLLFGPIDNWQLFLSVLLLR
jgi:hypothetical protein